MSDTSRGPRNYNCMHCLEEFYLDELVDEDCRPACIAKGHTPPWSVGGCAECNAEYHRGMESLKQRMNARLAREMTDAQCREVLGEDLYAHLADVMRPEYMPVWVNTPLPSLGGKCPREAMQAGNAEQVGRVIFLMGSGMPT